MFNYVIIYVLIMIMISIIIIFYQMIWIVEYNLSPVLNEWLPYCIPIKVTFVSRGPGGSRTSASPFCLLLVGWLVTLKSGIGKRQTDTGGVAVAHDSQTVWNRQPSTSTPFALPVDSKQWSSVCTGHSSHWSDIP